LKFRAAKKGRGSKAGRRNNTLLNQQKCRLVKNKKKKEWSKPELVIARRLAAQCGKTVGGIIDKVVVPSQMGSRGTAGVFGRMSGIVFKGGG